MAQIVPTITTDSPDVYKAQLDNFSDFASRVHVDVTDGQFAPSQTLNLNQLYWPENTNRTIKIDLHLMMNQPMSWLDQIVSLAPDKVILHAEINDASTIIPKVFDHLRKFGVSVGLALLPSTDPTLVPDLIKLADSVLIFGGRLGYQGGEADLTGLDKVSIIKSIHPEVWLEWDGGANSANVSTIAKSGIDQINVGKAISDADDAELAYKGLDLLAN